MSIRITLHEMADSARALRRAPAFTLLVVLTLALAVGASVAALAILRSVLWRPLPYPASSRLVVLSANSVRAAAGLSPAEVNDLNSSSQTLESVGSMSGIDASISIDGEFDRVPAASANAAVFEALGLFPVAMGRAFDTSTDRGPVAKSVIVSDEFWRRYLHADRAAIGRILLVNNLQVELVGVLRPRIQLFLPPMFNVGEQVDVWFLEGANQDWTSRGPATIGRLRDGVGLLQAMTEMRLKATQFSQARPAAYPPTAFRDKQFDIAVTPLHSLLTASVKPVLFVFGGVVALLLAVACLNVTNLILVRAMALEHEATIRRALGSDEYRTIVRRISECVLLVVASCAIGVPVGHALVLLLQRLQPAQVPLISTISIDGVVFALTAVLCVGLSFVLAGFTSARAGRAASLASAMTTRSGNSHRRSDSLRQFFVVSQVALAVIALTGAVLMTRTLSNLNAVPIGFQPDGIVTAKLAFSMRAFPDVAARSLLHRNALQRVGDLPGVTAVTAAAPLPFAPNQIRQYVGRNEVEGARLLASQQVVLPGYLDVVGTPLKQGRDLSDDDVTNLRKVVMIDERIATRLWPSGAIGQQLMIYGDRQIGPLEVVGVTGAVRSDFRADNEAGHLFLPYHLGPRELSLVFKTDRTAVDVGPSLKQAVRQLGTGRPPADIRPLREYQANALAQTRFVALVLDLFGGVTLLFAMLGVYGTLSYLVSIRTTEFGVRVALGGSLSSIVLLVLKDGVRLISIGTIVGLVAALGLARFITGLLYDVQPLDWQTIAPILALIVAVGVVSSITPLLRAITIDPSRLLRS